MRISRIDTYILKVPLGDLRFYSSQCFFEGRKCMLVRIETDTGLVGWGEGGQYGPAEPVAETVRKVFAPMLLGEDPLRPEVHWERMYALTRDFGRAGPIIEAIAGIDIALWDILGRHHNAPIYTLMGGAFRTEVQTYATGLYYRAADPLDRVEDEKLLREEAGRYAAAGFPALKMKIGLLTPEHDLRRVAAAREAIGPDMLLMVDANHAYAAHIACRIAKELERSRVYWFEEPVVPEDLEGYAQVKASTSIAIAGGECEYTRHGFLKLLSRRLVDIVQPDVCASGGLSEARKIAALASAYHVQCMPHVWGGGVAIAAGLHFIATLPPTPHTAFPRPPYNEPMLEWDAGHNPLRTDLLVEKIVPQNGKVAVPSGPGLGIRIDEEVLARYTVERATAS